MNLTSSQTKYTVSFPVSAELVLLVVSLARKVVVFVVFVLLELLEFVLVVLVVLAVLVVLEGELPGRK